MQKTATIYTQTWINQNKNAPKNKIKNTANNLNWSRARYKYKWRQKVSSYIQNLHNRQDTSTTTIKINMAQLNIHHVQAKITAYLDLEDLLQGETSDDQNITKLQTLQKIIKYLLANEDKWLTKDAAILYDIADNIVKNHYSDY